jgi:hypothetical protein
MAVAAAPASVTHGGSQADAALQSAAKATTAELQRTPWGDPDLEGIWAVGYTFTPLERPKEHAGKEFLTDDEIAALEKSHAERNSGDGTAGRQRGARGSVTDVEGAYNQAFSSLGKHERVIRTKRTSLIVDPPDGRIPSLTPEGQKRAASTKRVVMDEFGPAGRADYPEERHTDRCLGTRLPFIKGVGAGVRQIVQSPDAVAMFHEDGHVGGAFRTIPLGAAPALPASVRQWLGVPRGRWEANSLVVEVTHFSDKIHYQGFDDIGRSSGARLSESLRLTERYTRTEPDLIVLRITIDDPETFTRPWTIEVPLTKADQKANQIYESACHEGNYALTSILAGARLEEREKRRRASK